MEENCTKHEMDIQRIKEDLDDLKTNIYGNGRVGLKEKVTVLSTQFKIILALLVGNTGSIVFLGLKDLIK